MSPLARQRRRCHVQFSGRPCGAPFKLDVADSLWDSLGEQQERLFKPQSQTRKHNLKSVLFGPTIGVHFS